MTAYLLSSRGLGAGGPSRPLRIHCGGRRRVPGMVCSFREGCAPQFRLAALLTAF